MKLLLLTLSCLLSFKSFSQLLTERQVLDSISRTLPACPKPADSQFEKICTLIEAQDSKFQSVLDEMACVDRAVDNTFVVKAKVQRLWKAHLREFGCDSSGFPIEMGNLFKYAVYKEFDLAVNAMIKRYGISINTIDPADKKTLLDFVQSEMKRFEKMGSKEKRVVELKALYEEYRSMGALHASEIRS